MNSDNGYAALATGGIASQRVDAKREAPNNELDGLGGRAEELARSTELLADRLDRVLTRFGRGSPQAISGAPTQLDTVPNGHLDRLSRSMGCSFDHITRLSDMITTLDQIA
jgi:hypothetical protein